MGLMIDPKDLTSVQPMTVTTGKSYGMIYCPYLPIKMIDIFKNYCIGTKLKFVWLPKRCHISNKSIWLKFAYRQIAMYTGPGDPVFEYRWYNKNEFLVAKLKGDV
jgi:hypothetical protein